MLITYLEQFCVFFLGYGLLVPLLLDSRGEGIPHEVHKSIYEELNVRLFPITKLCILIYVPLSFLHSGDFWNWVSPHEGPDFLFIIHWQWLCAGAILLLAEQMLTDFLDVI
jgi:hypothetical protein